MSDNVNPWDEPTRWDTGRPDPADGVDAAAPAPPPVPPTPQPPAAAPQPPADLPVFGEPTPAAPPVAPTPPPAAPTSPVVPPVITPPAVTPPAAAVPPTMPTAQPPASPPPAEAPLGSAIGSHAPVSGAPVLTGNYGGSDAIAPAAPGGSGGGNGRFVWIAAILGALALLGGGAFLALGALGASGGGDTPEDAVDQLIAAVNGEDFVTIGELLDPGERRTIVEPVLTDILPELERLGMLGDDLDPADVEGVDFELADVTYRVDRLSGHDDIVHVWFTGGTASSEAIAAEFPWGDAIRERFGDDIEDSPRTTEQIEEGEDPMVLVERDGRWYVSMWHSVGESARLASGDRLPLDGDLPPALGSETAEAAAEAMVEELVDLDLRGIIGRIDPEEGAALYRYSPLFLGEAQSELNNLKRDAADAGVSWSITDMDFDVAEDGDDAVVTIRAFTATVTTPDVDVVFTWERQRLALDVNGAIDGEVFTGSLELTPTRWTIAGSAGGSSIDLVVDIDSDAQTLTLSGDVDGESVAGSLAIDEAGECSRYSFNGLDADESGCIEELLDEAGVPDTSFRTQAAEAFATIGDEFPGVPIHARKTDGLWYVSPTLTVMDGVTEGLRSITREDFDDFLRQVEEGSDTATFGFDDLIETPLDAADEFGDVDGLIGGGGDDAADTSQPFDNADVVSYSISAGSSPTVFSDVLGSNQQHEYTLTMDAGQNLGATLYGGASVSGGINDPVLRLVDSTGFEVAYNDDFDGLNSGLLYTAPAAGDYTIVVAELSAREGNYELTVELDSADESPSIIGAPADTAETTTTTAAPVGPQGGTLDSVDGFVVTPGSTVASGATLDVGTYDIVEVGIDTASTVTISLSSTDGSLDTRLYVYQDGALIAENDDAPVSAGMPNALDSQVVLDLAPGSYTVEVRSSADAGSGAYELTVTAE